MLPWRSHPRLCLVFLATFVPALPGAGPTPEPTTVRVDAALRRALGPAAPFPPRVDDESFLRRVSLDLTGKLPTEADASAFAADSHRGRLVERLLSGDAHPVNWGRYWRDVVTYHTPASNNYLRWELFDAWWADQVRTNRPWDRVVTALVTADGVNDESPPVNYLTALYGNPGEIAATTSRVFLGVQIQCAECHDAKGAQRWKRELFHGLAAFFGRAKLVQHKDVSGRGTPYAIEGRDDGQYLMADKKDPTNLLPMQPRFLSGESVGLGADDRERREALARLLTAPGNPWFARATVNRIWTCLMGWGFYPGVAEVDSAQPRYPEALEALREGFLASGHDMRWLFRTITATEAYQRQLQPPAQPGRLAPPAVCPQRLRPEQVFEALVHALAFQEDDKSIPAPAPSSAPAARRHTGLRHMVYQAFKTNPSAAPGEVRGAIPQALLMMNSALVHAYTGARSHTPLGKLLAEGRSDDQVVSALYQRTLARKPTPAELAVCRRFVTRVGDRQEALEDVFWALVNSTEFLTRR